MSTLARIQTHRASTISVAILSTAFALAGAPVHAQQRGGNQPPPPDTLNDPVRIMVARLDLEKYKATVKGLTQFGDRRQGTARNRAAIDWIEAQLKSYGCANTERLKYQFGDEPPHGVAQPAPSATGPQFNVGGARARGNRRPTGVNYNPERQPDEKLRALNAPPAVAVMREDVWCTKIGTTHPDEMYIVAAHMDGIGFGEAANDNGLGHRAGDGTGAHPLQSRSNQWPLDPLHPVEQ